MKEKSFKSSVSLKDSIDRKPLQRWEREVLETTREGNALQWPIKSISRPSYRSKPIPMASAAHNDNLCAPILLCLTHSDKIFYCNPVQHVMTPSTSELKPTMRMVRTITRMA